jgi:nucleotide-binding universal stress UspA family protein
MKIMVAYDGTLQAKEALVYGMEKAREKGGEVIALHVFNNRMFIDYDANVDAEAMARLESARFVEEAKSLIREKGAGVRTSLFTTDGNPEEEVVSFAKEKNVDVLLCPSKFKSIINKYKKTLGESELSSDAAKMNLAVFSAKTM